MCGSGRCARDDEHTVQARLDEPQATGCEWDHPGDVRHDEGREHRGRVHVGADGAQRDEQRQVVTQWSRQRDEPDAARVAQRVRDAVALAQQPTFELVGVRRTAQPPLTPTTRPGANATDQSRAATTTAISSDQEDRGAEPHRREETPVDPAASRTGDQHDEREHDESRHGAEDAERSE